ncbi:hypothetical protein MKW98_012397 [Papaver atlanticum]|uniref:Neprosin activation peptide domain-containing protein n=1 Tax=Papaver atlanticum TaxID=357466 RepID=A0AAD4SZD3_9MAGN|nr:hypothetical protein MKW98_012397 [Papaver atlanticum]
MSKFTEFTCWILILTIFVNEGLIEGRTTTKSVGNAEIIDCYDIYRQPSLNHPLLCNHMIQMRQTLNPKGTKSDNLGTLDLTQTWHKYGSCPEGTIPIRRKGKKLQFHNFAKTSLSKIITF